MLPHQPSSHSCPCLVKRFQLKILVRASVGSSSSLLLSQELGLLGLLSNLVGLDKDVLDNGLLVSGEMSCQRRVKLRLLLLHLHQGSLEQLVGFDLVQRGLEQNTVLTELILIIIAKTAAELLRLHIC
jgi:hypothetical protein